MKLLLAFSILLLSSHAFSQNCSRPVDKKRKVVFVAINYGPAEIQTAKRAACDRGEDFVLVMPSNSDKPIDALIKEFEKIKKLGGKPSSLIISGHSGGGQFFGETGNLSRSEIIGLFTEKFPEFREGLESLYLLGCYTGVKYEIFSWIGRLPNLKFIAGYDGSAPLATRSSGLNYLQDLMKQERTLSQQRNASNLNRTLGLVRSIEALNSAIYVKTDACKETDETSYYFTSHSKNDARLSVLNLKDCPQRLKIIQDSVQQVVKYYDGEVPLPEDSARGPLRTIYNGFRQGHHCISEGDVDSIPTPDQVMALLFYGAYSKNFAEWIKPSVEDFLKELDALTLEEWSKALDEDISSLEDKKSQEKQLLNDLPSYDSKKSKAKADADSKQSALDAFSRKPGNADVSHLVLLADGVTEKIRRDTPEPKRSELIRILTELNTAQMKYENYGSSKSDYEKTVKESVASFQNDINKLKATPRTSEALRMMKNKLSLPTKAELSGTRSKQLELFRRMVKANQETNLTASLRKKYAALTANTVHMMNNLQSLPGAWHEYPPQGAPGIPRNVISPNRMSGRYLENKAFPEIFEISSTGI